MTLAASAVRAACLAIAALFAAPAAQADIVVRFGSGHHSGFHFHDPRPGFGQHRLGQRHLMHKHHFAKKKFHARRHHFAHPPHRMPRVDAFRHRRGALRHHTKRHFHPPAVVVVPPPRVVIIERDSRGRLVPRVQTGKCHDFTRRAIIGGVERETAGTVCRQSDGSWRIGD